MERVNMKRDGYLRAVLLWIRRHPQSTRKQITDADSVGQGRWFGTKHYRSLALEQLLRADLVRWTRSGRGPTLFYVNESHPDAE